MQRRIQVLRQLVLDSQYAVDETSVAAAITTRLAARRLVSGTTFRNDLRIPRVSSFRPTRQVPSFRLCSPARAHDRHATIVPWHRR
jgi:hypothetical protein